MSPIPLGRANHTRQALSIASCQEARRPDPKAMHFYVPAKTDSPEFRDKEPDRGSGAAPIDLSS